MNTSDVMASLALVVSIISFWLSYRSARLSKSVAAAEKRTQAHSILVGVLLEVELLHALLRDARSYLGENAELPAGMKEIEIKFSDFSAEIPKRLDWLRKKASDDPILLEEYKIYALEIESRIRNIAPTIRDLQVQCREFRSVPSNF